MKPRMANPDSSVANSRRGGNFSYLFIGLLITLLATPFTHAAAGAMGMYALILLFSLFMLVAVWSLAASRLIFRLGALLVLAICGLAGATLFGGEQFLEPIALLLLLIFAGLSCVIAARNVFVLHRADLNSLLGAFCVYLLLGVIWACLYRMLGLCGLGAFAGSLSGEGRYVFPDLLYFSFVTLASLGYGDVTPVGGLVRTFAYLEAVTGQFYLAVMVASLVGAYTSRRTRE